MDFVILGGALRVSKICLGSMSWGARNSAAEGHAQINAALAAGVNFIDTAEMYAIPPNAERFGATETIIGQWLAANPSQRDKIVIASKMVGKAPNMPWIRDGKTRSDRANVIAALDGSLQRLKTDYIDLYQLHWPDRPTNRFGLLDDPQMPDDADAVPLLETLQALDEQVKAGKIRHIGISNETAWGMMRFLWLAEQHGLSRIIAIQNVYNLLNRSYEIAQSEITRREGLSLLAYSPLARGTLSGKYLDGALPPLSSRALDSRKSRYDTPRGAAAPSAPTSSSSTTRAATTCAALPPSSRSAC